MLDGIRGTRNYDTQHTTATRHTARLTRDIRQRELHSSLLRAVPPLRRPAYPHHCASPSPPPRPPLAEASWSSEILLMRSCAATMQQPRPSSSLSSLFLRHVLSPLRHESTLRCKNRVALSSRRSRCFRKESHLREFRNSNDEIFVANERHNAGEVCRGHDRDTTDTGY